MQNFKLKNIKLIESAHKYELANDPKFEFISCTTFAKLFFDPFDKIGIANSLSTTHPKYKELTPQQLIAKWDKIAREGTLIHLEVENFINDGTEPNHLKSKIAVEWLKQNITNIDRYEIFTEVIVYSKELALAGTIDLLIYDKENDEYKLLDWKTNRKIETRSFNNKMGHHKATCNLMDCNYYHYSIQLSLYRYILEKYYGLNVSSSAIAHLKNQDIIFYKTDYYRDEIEIMLTADRKELLALTESKLTLEFD